MKKSEKTGYVKRDQKEYSVCFKL